MNENATAPDQVSYWPFFRAAAFTTALAIGLQIFTIFLAGATHNAPLHVTARYRVVPFIAILAQNWATFRSIVFWSTVLTAVALAVYAISGLRKGGNAPQVQAGRAFAWFQMSIIGLYNLMRSYFNPPVLSTHFHIALVMAGLIGLTGSLWLINQQHKNSPDFRG